MGFAVPIGSYYVLCACEDNETRRKGDKEISLANALQLNLLVSVSPHLLVSSHPPWETFSRIAFGVASVSIFSGRTCVSFVSPRSSESIFSTTSPTLNGLPWTLLRPIASIR